MLIRGVDGEVYRRAKATASLRGVSMGSAVSEALRAWSEAGGGADVEELRNNQDFVKSHWRKLLKQDQKAVVVSSGGLQGVFDSYEEACSFAAKFRMALAFVVEAPPVEQEVELGPDLAVQR